MKVSRYNLIYPIFNSINFIVYNSLSGALAEIEPSTMDILESSDKISITMFEKNSDLLEKLTIGGFIIDEKINELSVVKQRFLEKRNDLSVLNLTISPTLDCNFDCFYCYQERDNNLMSLNIQDSITKLILDRRDVKKINVCWYGGEPLLSFNIIKYISNNIIDICHDKNIKYSSSMISNGYLLDEEKVDILKDFNLKNIQITIDGPPETHNKRRKLKECHKETFWKILENIKFLINQNISVTIRINVDNSNVSNIEKFIDILVKQKINKVSVYLGQLKPYSSRVDRLENFFLNQEEMAYWDLKLQQLLADKGITSDRDIHFPSQKSHYCAADLKNSFVIDHNGNLYKCWAELGDLSKCIGNIIDLLGKKANSSIELRNLKKWEAWTPFEDYKQCSMCKILPICMGGCAFSGMNIHKNIPECIKFKFNLKETLNRKINYRSILSPSNSSALEVKK